MMAGHTMPASQSGAATARGLSAQTVGLALVWLTLATSSVVFAEPAPYDALMLGLIFLLPLLGLTPMTAGLFLLLIVWLIIGASGLVASARSSVMDVSIKHTAITIYLSFSAVLIAAFIRRNPLRHSKLVMSGFMAASLLAVICGVTGYFGLAPGMEELFTKYGRARGTFKDPNVFGPFIVPALIYYLHGMASSTSVRALFQFLLAGLFCLGLLVSFSRGAWFNAAVALLVYAYLVFIAAQTHRFRLKLLLVIFFGLCASAIGFAAVMQIETIAELVRERATLALEYDVGPEGRFGGQLKAMELITTHPLGLGALEFGRSYHGEDVHNVYLSMFLNSGWIGGFLYLGLILATIGASFRHALRPSPWQGLMIVMLASFAGLAAEGLVVDTDHWRHFYVVLGALWGLILVNRRSDAVGSFRPNYSRLRNGRSGRI